MLLLLSVLLSTTYGYLLVSDTTRDELGMRLFVFDCDTYVRAPQFPWLNFTVECEKGGANVYLADNITDIGEQLSCTGIDSDSSWCLLSVNNTDDKYLRFSPIDESLCFSMVASAVTIDRK